MLPVFTGKITLTSAIPVDGQPSQFDLIFDFIDLEGVFSGLDALVNDFVFVDTSNYTLGTVSKYKIISIASQTFTEVQCRVQFNEVGDVIDPAYGIGIDSFMSRPTIHKSLTIIPSPGVQGLPDKFAFYPKNADFKEIVDLLEGGSCTAVEIDLKDQAASIPLTTLFTPTEDGIFLINFYYSCTLAGTAGTIKTALSWQDDTSPQSVEFPEVSLDTQGNKFQQSVFVKCKAGEPVSYSATIEGGAGSPEFSLYISGIIAGTEGTSIVGPQGPQGEQGIQGETGATGATGEQGDPGVGVPAGGTTDQILKKKSDDDFDTEWGDAPSGGGSTAQTDRYYVDGELGVDLTADGSISKPFKTIQACLNAIGQPINHIDAMRTIHVYISGNRSAAAGYSPQTFDGCYPENLTVPSRRITFIGYGVKIGDNGSGIPAGVGNILKEYSTSRRFGASSSELRPCLSFVGLCIARDNHQRLRNSFHVAGSCRTSILRRRLSSIQGDGVNHITVEVAAGQFNYPILVTANYPTEPYIRINVNNTVSYNGTYDITTKIDDTHFIATRVSGTNANTGVETAGLFFESDSAGSGAITHDSCSINTYMQGHYICDDGTVNYANEAVVPPAAGTEVLFSVGSRWYTGITGKSILMQRWEGNTLNSIGFTAGFFTIGSTYTITAIGSTDFTLIGASSNTVGVIFTATGIGSGSGTALLHNYVNSIAGLFNCSLAGALTLQSAFTYSADDMGLIANRFNSAVVINCKAATTLRIDAITYKSFRDAGGTFATNTPTIDLLGRSWDAGAWASRPTTHLQTGQMYYDTALNKPYYYNGGSWYDADGVIHA